MSLHVAYVCADPGVPVFGRKGCSVHVQEVLRALLRRGIRITLICAHPGGEPPQDLAEIPLHRLPRLPAQDQDDFHAHVEELALASERILRQLDGLDLIYERHALWSHRPMGLGSMLSVRTCLEVNAPLIQEQQRYRSLLHPQLAETCVRRAYDAADTIIAVSSQMAQSVHRQTSSPPGCLHVVHNGVDVQRFAQSSAPRGRNREGGLTIGFCGSLRPWHGVVDLVEAFADHSRRHPDNRLVIIGDGPERAAVEAAVEGHGITARVEMSGAVAPQQIPSWLARLDVGVAPYPDLPEMYFSPLKLFEYLAAGLCVVAPDLGDIGLLVEHERSALLYPAGDLAALSACLDRLSCDVNLRDEIASHGRQLAIDQYSWDRVVSRILTQAMAGHEGGGGDAA